MRRSYDSDNSRRSSRAVNIASAAVIIIFLLLAVMIVELVVLAILNAKLRADGLGPSDTTGAETAPAGGTTAPPQNINEPGYNSAYLDLTADYGQSYIDKIIFVGDSTTYGMKSKTYACLTGGTDTKQVWTPESGTLSLDIDIAEASIVYPRTGQNMSIASAAALEKPEYMVITLGINNGVPFLTESQFKQCYRKLLDAVITASPSTKIMLQSVYPVNPNAENYHYSNITNEKIDRANGWVADLALEYDLRYLDTNPTLKDTDGYLKYSYQNGDGLHLNTEGFKAVLMYIRTHGYPA